MKKGKLIFMNYAVFEKYQSLQNLSVIGIDQNGLNFQFNPSGTLRKIYCTPNKTIELTLNGFTIDKLMNDCEFLAIMRGGEIFLVPISDVWIDNRGAYAMGKDVFVFRVHEDIKIKAYMLQGWSGSKVKMQTLNEIFDKFMFDYRRKGGGLKRV